MYCVDTRSVHSCSHALRKKIPKFVLPHCAASALAQGSICYHCQVSGTTQSSLIGENVIFFGLNLVILLSKLGERLHHTPDFILIW